MSDDGRVQWGDLSRGEKVARTTQQSFNFLIVLAGAVLTVWIVPIYKDRQMVADYIIILGWSLHTFLSRGDLTKQSDMAI